MNKTTTPTETRGTSHTPGPWRVWRDMDPKEPIMVCGPSDDFVCEIAIENTQARSNTRLIAAAPELLAALADCVESLSRLPDVDNAYRVTCLLQARKAITKAKGQP